MYFHFFNKSPINRNPRERERERVKPRFLRFVFNLASGVLVGLIVGAIVLAFNNPTGNPTTGGGVIGVGSGAAANSLYIASSSNVGIGTASPSYTLDVNGTINASTAVNVGGTALPKYSDSRFKVVRFSRNLSLGNGTQTISLSNNGLIPKAFIFHGIVSSVAMTWGMDDLSNPMMSYFYGAASVYALNEGFSMDFRNGTWIIKAKVTAVDANGFTVTWSDAETSPSGTANINAMVFY